MINWPALKFPPINLFSFPSQNDQLIADYYESEYDALNSEISIAIAEESIKDVNEVLNYLKDKHLDAVKRSDEINFIYYTNTGKFLDG